MGFLDRLLGRTKEAGEDVTGEAKEAGEDVREKADEMMGEGKSRPEGAQEQPGNVADDAKRRTDM